MICRRYGGETRKATTGAEQPQGDGLRGILRQKDYLKATHRSGTTQPLVSSTLHTVLPGTRSEPLETPHVVPPYPRRRHTTRTRPGTRTPDHTRGRRRTQAAAW